MLDRILEHWPSDDFRDICSDGLYALYTHATRSGSGTCAQRRARLTPQTLRCIIIIRYAEKLTRLVSVVHLFSRRAACAPRDPSMAELPRRIITSHSGQRHQQRNPMSVTGPTNVNCKNPAILSRCAVDLNAPRHHWPLRNQEPLACRTASGVIGRGGREVGLGRGRRRTDYSTFTGPQDSSNKQTNQDGHKMTRGGWRPGHSHLANHPFPEAAWFLRRWAPVSKYGFICFVYNARGSETQHVQIGAATCHDIQRVSETCGPQPSCTPSKGRSSRRAPARWRSVSSSLSSSLVWAASLWKGVTWPIDLQEVRPRRNRIARAQRENICMPALGPMKLLVTIASPWLAWLVWLVCPML